MRRRRCELVEQEVGAENVDLTLGYVGMIHSNFPVNAVYQWSRGPEEAILYVDLNERLRHSRRGTEGTAAKATVGGNARGAFLV